MPRIQPPDRPAPSSDAARRPLRARTPVALAAGAALVVSALLAACGGSGGSGGGDANTGADGSTIGIGQPSGALNIQRLELAQTHLLPDGSRSWAPPSPAKATETLHLVGDREALALVRLSATNADRPMVEGLLGGQSLGTVALTPPAQLPPTEAGGPAYAGDLHSAVLPAAWLRPGLSLRVKAANYTAGDARPVEVGADMPFTLRVLPFYLFGADESNTGRPLSATAAPPADAVAELLAKWPVARLDAVNHPARAAFWPTLVIGPRGDASGQPRAAYVARSTTDYKDGFAGLAGVLGVLGALRNANGEGPLAVQYYAPLLALDAAGKSRGPGGGLGGGSVGAGDDAYTGIFVHEQGHAFGLPHAGEAYDDGAYPYAWGSLNGSAWGWDARRKEFLAPFVPTTASSYARCKADTYGGKPRTLDATGRCVKQDPMQSGAGDQASGYRYATFSDFSTAVMQRDLEGKTTLDDKGNHVAGGRLVEDAAFASGFKQWDTLDKRWVQASTATASGGIWGLDRGLATRRGVPVHAIVLTLSNADPANPATSAGITQIYPVLSFTGNLPRGIDPSSAEDRASIVPDTSTNYWYCRAGGCDFTLRLTYADGTVRHRLLQGGFRPFNQARGTPGPDTRDPLRGDSFRLFAVQVPGDRPLTRVELLDTPMAWEGLPAQPRVLAARTL
ncbi:M66 family metalloprotease [Mitsuaria sp. GD03876]|uniref:M66 family metalloprotease n=1 Tax=Mitsuaria sp. GD03876 TaxID=2975399 RepID=UPI00244D0BCE|nr:M66 family metalloprotease [Mitsuaria sp. GD03876]MDH0866704.1 M66 family metalloprotease [Mitsuaria sp. GD03876]